MCTKSDKEVTTEAVQNAKKIARRLRGGKTKALLATDVILQSSAIASKIDREIRWNRPSLAAPARPPLRSF